MRSTLRHPDPIESTEPPPESQTLLFEPDGQGSLPLAQDHAQRAFILNEGRRLKSCSPEWRIVMCGCELTFQHKFEIATASVLGEPPRGVRQLRRLSIVAWGRCMGGQCPSCAPSVARKRAVLAMKRLDARRAGRNVGVATFTIPPRRRLMMANADKANEARRMAVKLLKRYAGADYIVGATHPVGDKDPERFAPHFHLAFVPRNGYRGFVPPATVQAIKEAWAGFLNTPTVVIHFHYRKGSQHGQILHTLRYILRPFPGIAWKPQNAWYGNVPRNCIPECPNVCLKCGERRRVLGTANQADVDTWKATGYVPIPKWLFSMRFWEDLPPP